ncbi:MAG: coenzyme F420-0:L-glutamate ligase [Clostridiales bacterium]|jgi:hypothetical protein|nr:coenzyme F420-0:L-glutamate ligase [Clostridiales bacterium]
MEASALRVNEGKKAVVNAGGENYNCFAIKTKVVTDADKMDDVVREYAKPLLENGDTLFISEKMLACTQGRAIRIKTIKPGFLARLLSRFVMKSPAGIGLSMPETMQCALDECGAPRILLAAFVGAVGKLFRKRGWFYKVAGYKAACIDGPCSYTIPPYNECVVLAPKDPDGAAKAASDTLGGATVLVVDINDLGGSILGRSHPVDDKRILELLRQNPLGQSSESTPMGILRPMKEMASSITGDS